MKRRLFNIFAALSLLLFVATVGLWARSYRHFDEASAIRMLTKTQIETIDIDSFSGRIRLSNWKMEVPPNFDVIIDKPGPFRFSFESQVITWHARKWSYLKANDDGSETAWGGLGMDYGSGGSLSAWGVGWQIYVPISYCFAIAAVAPLIKGWGLWKRRKRRGELVCSKCGYDLRAHHPGERCPECATPIPATLAKEP